MAHHMTCAFGTFTISTFTIITICQHHHQRQCGGGVCECGGGVCLFPPVSACFCLNVPEWMASIGWPIYGCGFSRRRWQTRSSGYSMRVKTLLEKYFNVFFGFVFYLFIFFDPHRLQKPFRLAMLPRAMHNPPRRCDSQKEHTSDLALTRILIPRR